MENDVEVLTFEDIRALKHTIDNQRDIIDKLKAEMEQIHDENHKMRNRVADAENRMELLSELADKEDEKSDRETSTAGLQNILDPTRTAISNSVLLCLSFLLDTNPCCPIYKRVADHYNEEEIDIAKTILFDVWGPSVIRNKVSRRYTKKDNDLREIIKALIILRAEGTEPLYVASKEEIIELEEGRSRHLLSSLREIRNGGKHDTSVSNRPVSIGIQESNDSDTENTLKNKIFEVERITEERSKLKSENIYLKKRIMSVVEELESLQKQVISKDNQLKNTNSKSKIKEPQAELFLNETQNIGVLPNQIWPSQKKNYQILDDNGIQELTKTIITSVIEKIDEKVSMTIESKIKGLVNPQELKKLSIKGGEHTATTNIRNITKVDKFEQIIHEKERNSRSRNIIVHGLQENDGDEETKKDENLIKEIFEIIGAEHIPESVTRLGGSQPQRTRPVKLEMKSKIEKDNVMSKLSNLKNAVEHIKKIHITDDYTLQERREIQNWVRKAKERNQYEGKECIWKVRGTPKDGMRLVKFQQTPAIQEVK